MIDFKKLVQTATAFGLLALGAANVHALDPGVPVRIIVPWSAGGAADIAARAFAERVGGNLGGTAIVENRAGANGTIGGRAVADAKADGQTILQMTTAHVIYPSLSKDIPYDWKRDFTPVYGIASIPMVLLVPGESGIRSMADLVAASKSAPGGLSYASGGNGSLSHLAGARLVQELKINATHIPYKGMVDAAKAVLSDGVHFTFVTLNEAAVYRKSEKLRALGVATEQRNPLFADVPTLSEQGVPVLASSWTGYVVPAKTPRDVVERFHTAFAKAARNPDMQRRLGNSGMTLKDMSAADYGKFMHDESAAWQRVIEAGNISAK